MSRQVTGRSLIALIDELRAAYELAGRSGLPELRGQLLTARRSVLALVQQYLTLKSEHASLRETLKRYETRVRAAQAAAEEALFTTRRESQGPRKPS